MIRIKDVISTDSWLFFRGSYDGEIKSVHAMAIISGPGAINLRFKISSFTKLDLSLFSKSPQVDEADVWCLELKVIGMNQQEIRYQWKDEIILVDREGYQFFPMEDYGIYLDDYSIGKGWDRFFSKGLQPKIAANGAIFFQLPLGETEFAIAVKNGFLEKVIEPRSDELPQFS